MSVYVFCVSEAIIHYSNLRTFNTSSDLAFLFKGRLSPKVQELRNLGTNFEDRKSEPFIAQEKTHIYNMKYNRSLLLLEGRMVTVGHPSRRFKVLKEV